MSNPLGLNEDQRLASDVAKYVEDLTSGRIYQRNVQMITDLPPGALIQWGAVAYTREHLLELIA